MRSALSDEDAFDCCAAGGTGKVCTLVDLEIVLEAAAAVYPVNAGPVAADAFL